MLEKSFMFLLDLVFYNPENVTHIETYYKDFMAMGCFIWVFQSNTCQVICIDSVFLKGRYHETLFIILVKDSNNQIYLLAFNMEDKEEIEP